MRRFRIKIKRLPPTKLEKLLQKNFGFIPKKIMAGELEKILKCDFGDGVYLRINYGYLPEPKRVPYCSYLYWETSTLMDFLKKKLLEEEYYVQ